MVGGASFLVNGMRANGDDLFSTSQHNTTLWFSLGVQATLDRLQTLQSAGDLFDNETRLR
jgi:hypothetical protein